MPGRTVVVDWVAALRLHQWLKNLLVFVPLFAAHLHLEPSLVLRALAAFAAFSLCASGVYLLNDLLDLEDDRNHPVKSTRPFAAGRIPVRHGVGAIPALLAASFGLALWLLPGEFAITLGVYYTLTVLYSLVLKRHMMLDVVTLASLYTLRVIAGGTAIGVTLSFWLLAFSMFMFLSLALVKRYAELFQAHAAGQDGRARGRGYFPDDLPIIAALGAASGYMAVLVLALYINDANTARLYARPQLIWLACPLLLVWIGRVWMLAHRGRMSEDPVIFAIRDRTSLGIGTLLAVVFWAAS